MGSFSPLAKSLAASLPKLRVKVHRGKEVAGTAWVPVEVDQLELVKHPFPPSGYWRTRLHRGDCWVSTPKGVRFGGPPVCAMI
jgi:hypothetical protein